MSEIRIPGAVWEDALNPLVSGMAQELGLPEPRFVRRGRGSTAVYDNVTVEQARDVAEYIGDRGLMLLNQGVDDPYDPIEKQSRDCYRAAVRTAERLRAELKS